MSRVSNKIFTFPHLSPSLFFLSSPPCWLLLASGRDFRSSSSTSSCCWGRWWQWAGWDQPWVTCGRHFSFKAAVNKDDFRTLIDCLFACVSAGPDLLVTPPPPGLSSRSTQTRVDCLPSLNSIIIHNIIGKTVDENGLVFSSTTDQPRTWGRLLWGFPLCHFQLELSIIFERITSEQIIISIALCERAKWKSIFWLTTVGTLKPHWIDTLLMFSRFSDCLLTATY